MLKILVSFALGPWWLKVLFFYLEHDAIINSIVFIYGVFLVAAHLNYRKISEQIFSQIPSKSDKKTKKKLIEINIPKAIEEKKMFPFVAGQISLFPKKTTTAAVKKYLLKEKKWKELIGEREVLFIE
ncbi:MAG: hypothetical protein MUO42_05190 [Anaerolineaceae bacterium]|nr:hypothetical protein [Anaerolineaceae bacterium]